MRPWVMGMLAVAMTAAAQEDLDLGRIPEETVVPPTSAPPAAALKSLVYLESATEGGLTRTALSVPFPSPGPPELEERLLLDARLQWVANRHLTFTLNARAEARASNTLPFPSHEDLRLDVREVYVTWAPIEGAYLDVGRINLKSGAALGFNPTDFFKTRSVVEPLSLDPSVLREDRLGTLMVRAQYVFSKGAIAAAFAPALYRPTPLYSDAALPSVNPMLDRTNAHNRFLLKANLDVVHDFSPEVLLYDEDGAIQLGASLAQSIGQQVVVYAEWSAGRMTSMAQQAYSYGILTGTLPSGIPSPIPVSPGVGLKNNVSTGLSYATPERVTFWLEYHLHQAGFDRTDWSHWLNAGSSPLGRRVAPALWYTRGYALDQQEPVSKHELFFRADWLDVGVSNLELSGFVAMDLYDASVLAQVTAAYAVSNAWSVAVYAAANLGRRSSDYGSLPQTVSGLFTVRRYF